MIIKVCGMKFRDNIEELVKSDPDMLGLIFYPASPRFPAETLKPEDLSVVPEGIKITGVFVNAGKSEIMETSEKYSLDIIQLHGSESPGFCMKLNRAGLQLIKAFNVHEGFDFHLLEEYMPFCRYFLFDTQTKDHGGSGIKFNWDILENYKIDHPFLLSGGISPQDMDILKDYSHPFFAGIDINSRFETAPGRKDIIKVSDFIKRIRKKN